MLWLLLSACTNPAADDRDSGNVDHGEFSAVAEAADDALDDLDATGLAVAIFDRDGVVWHYGTGSRRLDGSLPVDADTRFRFGSALKMMTATALIQQQDAGSLNLDAPLSTVLPDFEVANTPSWSDAIVLGQLTSHQAGLWDFADLDRGPDDDQLAAGVDWFAETAWLTSPPGTFFNYSNANFSVAGRAVEVAAGRSYAAVMHDDVFAPLGMSRTSFLGQAVMDEDDNWAESRSYDWTGQSSAERDVLPNSYDSAFTRPAGLAFTSVDDLAVWGGFLLNGDSTVLSAEGHRLLTTPVVDLNPVLDTQHYAHGIFVLDEILLGASGYRVPTLAHGGDIAGFAADIYVLPDQGWGVAILASGDGAHATKVVVEALRLSPGLPAPTPLSATPPFDPATLSDFAGAWNDPFNVGPMTLTVEDGKLTADLPLLDEYGVPYDRTLTPVAEDNFVWNVQNFPFSVTFHRDAAGTPEWLRTRSFVLQRDALRGVQLSPLPTLAPRILPTALPSLAR